MSPKEIAEKFLTAWNADHHHIVDELAAPDIIVAYPHFPEPLRGVDAFQQALSQTYACFPDIRIEAEEIVIEGDRVVVFWTYRGTHQAGELFGIQPSGRRVNVSGVSRYRIQDGQVVEERGIVDNLSLMAQLKGG